MTQDLQKLLGDREVNSKGPLITQPRHRANPRAVMTSTISTEEQNPSRRSFTPFKTEEVALIITISLWQASPRCSAGAIKEVATRHGTTSGKSRALPHRTPRLRLHLPCRVEHHRRRPPTAAAMLVVMTEFWHRRSRLHKRLSFA